MTLTRFIDRDAFVDCCGIDILSSFEEGETTTISNIKDLSMVSKGVTLIALSHLQWTKYNLTVIKEAGFNPILTDFYNANTGNRITLFAKIHHPLKQNKKSWAWVTAAKYFT